jgi:hypothetical protein
MRSAGLQCLSGLFFVDLLNRNRVLNAVGQAAITLIEASNWTQNAIHVESSVPTTPLVIPRTRAMPTIRRLRQRTTAMLSFRVKLKDDLRRTTTGIEITARLN